ncbi:hypothetical protein [Candidatus Viadribacter manganicus]|uniref:Uncharacterized protein n=1 Tax=Candidatus Viadribacter manganicus TaxID=1759059 RepID=A0A1B1AI12_9PROT|nr:hypothetical protein [Candidatus Viadribacter manganicus]ANP46203.1 hypothetical protein ATE48_09865 [Candidatus Viadribacter manganicus]
MKSKLYAGALAVALGLATPAHAQFVSVGTPGATSIVLPVSGITYFNRAGATLADQQADLEACHSSVIAMQQPYQSSGAGAAYGLVGALTEAAIASGQQQIAQRRALHPHYENCMVMRGWRVVRLSETRGAELDTLDQASLATQLAPLVGAETPEGEVARVFGNEIAQASSALYGYPTNTQARSLSIQALPPESSAYISPPATTEERNARRRRPGSGPQTREEYDARRNAIEAEHSGDRRDAAERQAIQERATAELVGPGDVANAVRPRDVARLPENSTLLIVRVHGLLYGSGVILMRPGAEEDTVDFVSAIVPTAFISGPKEQTVIARVPPGRWRLSGFVGAAGYVTSLCMGSPTFDIAEGDVVFAGSFGFGTATPRIDLSLDPARTALATAPNLAARVHAAEYRNGDTFVCGAAANFYGYEIADAPYLDSYRFGSRVNYTPPAALAPSEAPALAREVSTPAPAN